jgi:hypothetical protein
VALDPPVKRAQPVIRRHRLERDELQVSFHPCRRAQRRQTDDRRRQFYRRPAATMTLLEWVLS